jgi:hypothetical protein
LTTGEIDMPEAGFVLFLSLVLVMCVGCDDQEKNLRDWQQRQVDQLQRQSQENSAAARALVEADAESRRQFAALEQSIQAERQELAGQYSTLEADRKAVALAREQVPLLATAFQGLAALALGIAALWVCGRLLSRRPDDEGAAELEETLILSLAGESDLFAEQPVRINPPKDLAALANESVTDAAPAWTDG